jgi:asparagine synthase (glutamine-hydrolysing)
MCGIAGYVQRASASDDLIDRMTDRLAHRGPDGRGVWRGTFGEWSIALGHRRLAIIDLQGGTQPLGNEDGSVQITYNGEVYNFALLRERLLQRGHQFATHCDTESIIHHFEDHGPEGFASLDGMFALGIWDQSAGQLTLARDRIGVKPLYYAPLPDGGIAFASELSALLVHPDVDRAFDERGLASFFFRDYVQPPTTIVRGAQKLEPGHSLIWNDGKLSSARRFWHLRVGREKSAGDQDSLRTQLHAAVKAQLVSDVPVGVFLSGGIDSSLVAALAQQHSSHRLKTFTIRFDDPQFDESPFARRVARHIDSEHVEERFTESGLLDCFEDALSCLDEPMADSSILPTYILSRLASRHVKVCLGGDGGDELWAGYPTYKAHRWAHYYDLFPAFVRQRAIDPIVRKLPLRDGYQSFEWKAKRFALRWDDDPGLRHLRWMSNLDLPELHQAIPTLADFSPELHPDAHIADLNDVLALDLATYLPGSVLTKVDRASMAHGLEVRPPLLANELVDFAFSRDSSCKLHRGTSKWLLKRAVSRLLPPEIIHRRKKGFAIPLARWLRGPLRERLKEAIRSSPLWDSGLLSQFAFSQWQREHEDFLADHSRPLYALLVLDDWYRRQRSAAHLPRKEGQYA